MCTPNRDKTCANAYFVKLYRGAEVKRLPLHRNQEITKKAEAAKRSFASNEGIQFQ